MTDEKIFEQENSETQPFSLPKSLTRRQMLRTMAKTSLTIGGISAVGGGLLTACGGTDSGNTTAPEEKVTLLLHQDWPFQTIPANAKKGETDPMKVGQIESINAWLSQNKSVTLKHTAIKIENDQQREAAISARTNPDIFASYGTRAYNRGYKNGTYSADMTPLYSKYKVDSLLADYAKPLLQPWSSQGKWYGLPGDAVSVGAGLFYRRDLLKEKSIAEPQFGWSWDDFYTLIKKFQTGNKPVMGAPSWQIGRVLGSNQLDPVFHGGILGSLPAPNDAWHWKINVDPFAAEWKDRISFFRKLTVGEKLIDQNPSVYFWEGPAMGKFGSGEFPFSPGYGFHATLAVGPVSVKDITTKYPDKTFDELVGFVPYPKGTNGAYSSDVAPNLGLVLFNPYIKGAHLDKAASLWLYMFFGDGYINSRAKKYELTKDPKQAYDYIAPANIYQKNPKVPVGVDDKKVYGDWANLYLNIIRTVKPVPTWEDYFAPDQTAAPGQEAHNDLLSAASGSNTPVEQLLKKYTDTYTAQSGSRKSSLSADEFKASAKQYYAALDEFWKANASEFAAGDWAKFYTQVQSLIA